MKSTQLLTAVIANANASLRWLAPATPNLDEAGDAVSRILRDGNRAGEVIGISMIEALTN
jgi:hypothetical protein